MGTRSWDALWSTRSNVGRLITTAAAVGALVVAGPTTATADSSRHNCSKVYWRTSRSPDQRCPSSHSVLADISYRHLHWTRWTRTHADGLGDQLAFDDASGPPAGSIVQGVAISLTHPRQCTAGRSIYTRISVTIYADSLTIPLGEPIPLVQADGPIASRFHKPLNCNPTSGVG
jgi:hypothetical protein